MRHLKMRGLLFVRQLKRLPGGKGFLRIKQGESPWVALGDFLDDWRRSALEDRLELVAQPLEAAMTPDEQRWATLFAGAIEELCLAEGLPIPSWVMEPRYYLEEPWYPTARKEAFRRFVEEATPVAFKLRKVFIGDRALLRV
jgi:hypothetical protein